MRTERSNRERPLKSGPNYHFTVYLWFGFRQITSRCRQVVYDYDFPIPVEKPTAQMVKSCVNSQVQSTNSVSIYSLDRQDISIETVAANLESEASK